MTTRYNQYSKGKIYKITEHDTGRVFLGATIKSLEYLRTNLPFIVKRADVLKMIENNNYSLDVLENYNCHQNWQLKYRLNEWIQQLDCINK